MSRPGFALSTKLSFVHSDNEHLILHPKIPGQRGRKVVTDTVTTFQSVKKLYKRPCFLYNGGNGGVLHGRVAQE